MLTKFNDAQAAVALLRPDQLPYPAEEFTASVRAALEQDLPPREVLIVDGRGPDARPDFAPDAALAGGRVRHVAGQFASRAAMCNAALRATRADWLLLVDSDAAAVTLRRSALQTYVMAAVREDAAAMVYADYERQDGTGQRCAVHLLDWHAGRVRDTTDFGAAVLYATAVLRDVGGWDERYTAAEAYDLRLRLGERHRLAHVANRYAGALYSVAAPPAAHNVFAYLLTSRPVQRELERAFTEHLRRVGAWLAPGAHVRRVEDSPAEEARECIATVVTPVNQRPGFIGRAIESVQAQTEPRVEMVVVVNGGEDDPTCAAVRAYMPGGAKYRADRPAVRLRVVDVNNLGLCLNLGLQDARGKYYVQLDSDDRLKPDAIEKLRAVFEADPAVGMVVGSYEVWTLDEASGALRRNEEIPVVTHPEWTAENGRNNLLRINGAGAPRAAHIAVIAECGWFGVNDTPQSRNYGEDYDLVLRISERYTIGRVWDPIYEVIRHSGGTDHAIDAATIERNDNAKDTMRMAALQRRQRLNTAAGRPRG